MKNNKMKQKFRNKKNENKYCQKILKKIFLVRIKS